MSAACSRSTATRTLPASWGCSTTAPSAPRRTASRPSGSSPPIPSSNCCSGRTDRFAPVSTLPSALPEPTNTPLRGGPVLRWGILAPGVIADAWTSTVHAHTDQRVVAVASRDAGRAAAFASRHGIPRSYGDYEQLVADPEVDVVYIAPPHTEHTRLALLAI